MGLKVSKQTQARVPSPNIIDGGKKTQLLIIGLSPFDMLAAINTRERIKNLFLKHIGKIITKEQISREAGISEWARQVRELRDEYGYEIKSYKEMPGRLKPGEYLLESPKATPRAKKISKIF